MTEIDASFSVLSSLTLLRRMWVASLAFGDFFEAVSAVDDHSFFPRETLRIEAGWLACVH